MSSARLRRSSARDSFTRSAGNLSVAASEPQLRHEHSSLQKSRGETEASSGFPPFDDKGQRFGDVESGDVDAEVDAAQRGRARRYRGGRMGGGTRGWGFADDEGDSNRDSDSSSEKDPSKNHPITLGAAGKRLKVEWEYWQPNSRDEFWATVTEKFFPNNQWEKARVLVWFEKEKRMGLDVLNKDDEIPFDEIKRRFNGTLPSRWRLVPCHVSYSINVPTPGSLTKLLCRNRSSSKTVQSLAPRWPLQNSSSTRWENRERLCPL